MRMASLGMGDIPGRRVNVGGEAGDLLIWNRLTPHGSSRRGQRSHFMPPPPPRRPPVVFGMENHD
jgi:hypothetical protein